MKLDKVTRLFLLTTAALLLYWLESVIGLPGVIPCTLGLSLITSLFALWVLNFREAAILTLLWVLLGAMIFRGFEGFLYYGPASVVAFLAIWGLRALLKDEQIWIAGCMGTVVHGLSCLFMLMWLQRTLSWLLFFPAVMLFSIVWGLVMGLCAQFVIIKGKNVWKTIFK